MKKIIRKIIFNKITGLLLIKPILTLHSLSYFLADTFSIILENGIHPKHRIIKYKEWFLEHIEPGWIVLDIGSNIGLVSEFLADKAEFVYGIEIKNELVEEAKLKRKKTNIEYVCADATKFNFSSLKQVDCVILSNILEHIKDRVNFLKNLVRDLIWRDPNRKTFLIRVPMINRDWVVLYKKELGIEYRSDKGHFIEYTIESFYDELNSANIRILEYEVKFGEIHAICAAAF